MASLSFRAASVLASATSVTTMPYPAGTVTDDLVILSITWTGVTPSPAPTGPSSIPWTSTDTVTASDGRKHSTWWRRVRADDGTGAYIGAGVASASMTVFQPLDSGHLEVQGFAVSSASSGTSFTTPSLRAPKSGGFFVHVVAQSANVTRSWSTATERSDSGATSSISVATEAAAPQATTTTIVTSSAASPWTGFTLVARSVSDVPLDTEGAFKLLDNEGNWWIDVSCVPVTNDSTGVPRPPNDDIENAQLLTGSDGQVVGRNTYATVQVAEPEPGVTRGANSVWYKWYPPSEGYWWFHTGWSDFDTVMSMYRTSVENPTFADLVHIGDSDDGGDTRVPALSATSPALAQQMSSMLDQATSGNWTMARYIRVCGYDDAEQRHVVLNWNANPTGVVSGTIDPKTQPYLPPLPTPESSDGPIIRPLNILTEDGWCVAVCMTPWDEGCDNVDFASVGWRYYVASQTDTVDRSGVDFDYSSWDEGQAPFGDDFPLGGVTDNGVESPNTIIPTGRTVWMRRSVFAHVDRGIQVRVRSDDGAQIWWDGRLLQTQGQSFGTWIDVPDDWITTGFHEVAVKVSDTAGSHIYADASVRCAVPLYIMTTEKSGQATDFTLEPADDVVAGDFLISFMTTNSGFGPTGVPAGWTLLDTQQQSCGSYATYVYTRRADGTSGDNITIHKPDGSVPFYQITMRGYRGVGGVQGFSKATEGCFAQQIFYQPALTTTEDNLTILYFAMTQSDSFVGDTHGSRWGVPFPDNQFGVSSSRSYHRYGDLTQAHAGPVVQCQVLPGTSLFGYDAASWTGYTIALTSEAVPDVIIDDPHTPPDPEDPPPPTAWSPTNLHTTAVTTSSVTIAWTAPGSPAVNHYEVQQGNGAWINNSTTLSHAFSGLNAGTSYTFRVRAVDASNVAGPAATIAVFTTAASGGGGGGSGTTRALLGARAIVSEWDLRVSELTGLGGRIEARRVFFSDGFSGANGSNTYKSQVAQAFRDGQYPVISFDENGSWASVANGSKDSALVAVRNYLQSLPGPAFVSYGHEQFVSGGVTADSGFGSVSDHDPAQRHFIQTVSVGNSHIDFGLILNGFMFNSSGNAKLSDAQLASIVSPTLVGLCDVISSDTYQGSATSESAAPKIRNMCAWGRRVGASGIGVGEWNAWGPTGVKDIQAVHDSLNAIAEDSLIKWACVFDSPRGGLGSILAGEQLRAFQQHCRDWRADGTPPPPFPTP